MFEGPVTVKEMTVHGRPPDPDDVDMSKVKESQMLITDGAPMDTIGFNGSGGVATRMPLFSPAHFHVRQNKGSYPTQLAHINPPVCREMASLTDITIAFASGRGYILI